MRPRHRWRYRRQPTLKTTSIGYRDVEFPISEYVVGVVPTRGTVGEVLVKSPKGKRRATRRLVMFQDIQQSTYIRMPKVNSASTKVFSISQFSRNGSFRTYFHHNPTWRPEGRSLPASSGASRRAQAPITVIRIRSVTHLRYPLPKVEEHMPVMPLHQRQHDEGTPNAFPDAGRPRSTSLNVASLTTFSGAKPGTSTSSVTEHAACSRTEPRRWSLARVST